MILGLIGGLFRHLSVNAILFLCGFLFGSVCVEESEFVQRGCTELFVKTGLPFAFDWALKPFKSDDSCCSTTKEFNAW